ncbi:tetratricopeptide repeat protein [Acidisphaera sp. S103]|uniref:tetratricopeptide repeat-containing glycosyltransferase family protein n=1 Tax=Acidisphaera sp. S103 TaxID=1747223 RepID=UPI00131AEE00|nr:tetratricopeptide repeat-containing glycosyltransferase family protein [Acidisphaera sp. S103]
MTQTVPAAVQPVFAAALHYHQAGRLDIAERMFRQVLASQPRHADSLHLLGVIAYQTGRRDLAMELIGKAIAINPREASSRSNLGNLLLEQGRLEEAVASYRKAIALRPGFSEAANNLGNALKALGRLDEAVGSYRLALEPRPDDAEVHYNLAMALLARGDMAAGWAEHEWRWKTRQLSRGYRGFAQPQWFGEAADGRTLLIHAEQGFGDTIQFCRYAPLAAAMGWRVVLEVPRPLVRLLGGLPGVERVVAFGEALPDFDLQCPMLSLPLALGTTLATIPGDGPYLQADAGQCSAWRVRLDALDRPGPRVGLVWAGNPRAHLPGTAAIGRQRSIAPERLAPLLALPNLHFVSLQKDGVAPPADASLTDFMGEVGDFADTAALIGCLDLVVSIDTSVAHLAGALGKPVWLLTCFDPCWRWLTERRDSPWYPGMRLYRQPRPGDWEAVVAAVGRDLLGLGVV